MITDKILEFYSELRDEVALFTKENIGTSLNFAFKTVYLSYLTELGETLLSDCTIVDFKRDSDNMRLDGYSYSEYFQSLTLLVSKYNSKPSPEKIRKIESNFLATS